MLASPGPLSAATPRATRLQGFQSHADFENKCGRCHAPVWGTERMADRCMACHSSVAEAIVSGEGLHGRLRDPRDCKTCHTEHQGRQARLTRLDVAGFPHEVGTVGFTLAQHKQDFDDSAIECQQCHTETLSALDQATCIDCHAAGQPAFTDQHRADVGDDCLACHDGSGQLTKFDHDKMTGFPLAGEHREARCQDCHTDKRFKGLDSACTSCHLEDDRHKGQFGASCESCHTPEKWEQATFRHDLEPFTFEGRPLDITTNCVTCHRQDDEHRGQYGDSCESCHTPEKWERVTFRHDLEPFTFEGRPFDITTNCVTCHRLNDEHNGRFGTECQRCHIPEEWDRVTFNHNETDFPLTGGHARVECEVCHAEGKFTGLELLCVACHREDDAHEGRFGDACYKCHVADGWDQVTFDHNRTMFPLEGAHRDVACEKCHTIERFAFTPMDCVACHAEPRVHLGLLGTRCADCHTVNAWSPALLPEHTFPLNHRSRKNIACDVCHDQGTFELYTCYNCHEHNPAKIERKHLEEGIRNFQDCMRCHPTGREHEGEGRERGEGDD